MASSAEEEIYSKLGLDYVPPELRENTGEIEAAEKHQLPKLVELRDIKGDLQMHTTASDGKNSIEEMATAAKALGHEYIAITDHSKAVTVANGLDDKRMADAHQKSPRRRRQRLRASACSSDPKSTSSKDGKLDYSDEILAAARCDRLLHPFLFQSRARRNDRPHARRHRKSLHANHRPPYRPLFLRRDELDYDVEKIFDACAKYGVAMECNSYPDRLDLKDVYLRMCKEKGVKVVISTDSHSTTHFSFIRYGVTIARRGWLEKKDVINTLPVKEFLGALRRRGKEART